MNKVNQIRDRLIAKATENLDSEQQFKDRFTERAAKSGHRKNHDAATADRYSKNHNHTDKFLKMYIPVLVPISCSPLDARKYLS
jgi:hypothetical protein